MRDAIHSRNTAGPVSMNQTLINLLLGMGALASPLVTIVLLKQRWRKGEAEIRLDKITEAKIADEVASSTDQRERDREAFWQEKLDAQDTKLCEEIRDLRLEVNVLKRYINRHIPWDWEAVRLLKLADINVPNPPSLNYLNGDDRD